MRRRSSAIPATLLLAILIAWSLAAAADEPRVGEVRCFEAPSAVTSSALSADGHRAAAGMKDGALWLWDIETAKMLRKFAGPKEEVTSLTFSGDGKRLFSGNKQGLIVVWDAESSKELHRLEGHRDAMLALAVTHKNKQLLSYSGGVDGSYRRWDLEKFQEVEERRLGKYTSHVYAMAFAPDGKGAATGYSSYIRIWDGSGHEHGKLEGHKGRVAALAYSPDGKLLASASKDKTVRIWDVAGKREFRVHEGHKGAVTCVAFSSDGQRLLSGGDDNTVRLWDVQKQVLHTFEGHSDEVTGVAFTPDGKYALSASHDKTLRLWRLPK